MIATLFAAHAFAAAPQAGLAQAAPLDSAARAEVEAVVLDYMDAQYEGDCARVAHALHPDLARRAAEQDQAEILGLRRMAWDLRGESARAIPEIPHAPWRRTVQVLEHGGGLAMARVETPGFVDYVHLGRHDGRWVIVNAMWYPKSRAA